MPSPSPVALTLEQKAALVREAQATRELVDLALAVRCPVHDADIGAPCRLVQAAENGRPLGALCAERVETACALEVERRARERRNASVRRSRRRPVRRSAPSPASVAAMSRVASAPATTAGTATVRTRQ